MTATCDLLSVTAVAVLGVAAAAVDLRTRRVPNALTFGAAAAGLLLAGSGHTNVTLWMALGGFAVGLGLMLPGHLIGATGAGDVKLLAAAGTFLGPTLAVTAFVYTALAGGVLALLVATLRRSLRPLADRTLTLILTRGGNAGDIEDPRSDNRFAYAPAIAIGAFAAAMWG